MYSGVEGGEKNNKFTYYILIQKTKIVFKCYIADGLLKHVLISG